MTLITKYLKFFARLITERTDESRVAPHAACAHPMTRREELGCEAAAGGERTRLSFRTAHGGESDFGGRGQTDLFVFCSSPRAKEMGKEEKNPLWAVRAPAHGLKTS
ncbi:hypothetical protein EVAR_65659_1 [Eumeta japonica]|uniref:Uncharacterized protein n=1 Tax=Eumeta variegata TaxID=151549 RepID=A0A4C1Z462_EUMVA|nr:hypothetical protein EVAR_65659_1 [Eumeta japonica]